MLLAKGTDALQAANIILKTFILALNHQSVII